jgi:hypothetical protein
MRSVAGASAFRVRAALVWWSPSAPFRQLLTIHSRRGARAQLAAMLLPALQMAADADAPRAAPTAAQIDLAEQRRWVVELLESYVAHEETRDVLRRALLAACPFPCPELHPSAVPLTQSCRKDVIRCISTPFLEAALHPLSSATAQSRRETMSTFHRLRCMLPCLPLQCSGPLPPRVCAVLVRRLARLSQPSALRTRYGTAIVTDGHKGQP